MPRFVDVDPCVFLSVHWADWVGAFGHKRLSAVAKSLGLSVEGLVEYVAEQPPRAVGVARLLCKLADFGRICQYAATGRPGGYARLQVPYVEVEQDPRLTRKLVALSPCALLDVELLRVGKRGVKPSRYPPVKWRLEAPLIYRLGGIEALRERPRETLLRLLEEKEPWLLQLYRERGVVYIANQRWCPGRCRRQLHLAEWLVWLTTGRLVGVSIESLSQHAVSNGYTANAMSDVISSNAVVSASVSTPWESRTQTGPRAVVESRLENGK